MACELGRIQCGFRPTDEAYVVVSDSGYSYLVVKEDDTESVEIRLTEKSRIDLIQALLKLDIGVDDKTRVRDDYTDM